MSHAGLRCAAQCQLGECEGVAIDGGAAQINQPLPAHRVHVVFAIRDDSRHNLDRSHGVGFLESLVTNKDKALRHASTFTSVIHYSHYFAITLPDNLLI